MMYFQISILQNQGEYKLKLSEKATQGVGIGDTEEEIIELLGEPDVIPHDESAPDRINYSYSSENTESFTIVFSPGPNPVVEFINVYYYNKPISFESFKHHKPDLVYDLSANMNIYSDKEILFYAYQNGMYNVKLINRLLQPDIDTSNPMFEDSEITLEQFLEKVESD
ncbi:hypothetical protein ACQCT3_02425 [Sutcliffiella horikoshii]|uniref:hypothetical protein n=1 Tax=Sutcliffiella horikoshii TaxID=79883 RepID=UPI003CF45A4E